MITALLSRLVILIFGTLYPAYSSYKAVKTKDIKLYVKWMMYWIVFALFSAAETFTDVFFGFWFPFYHEIKILFVFWLLLPVTKGSSIMYRKVIHPLLLRREQEIDELITKAKDQGYNVILDFGCKSVSLATNAIMSTAVKNAPTLSSNMAFESHRSRRANSKCTSTSTSNKKPRLQSQTEPITELDGGDGERCDYLPIHNTNNSDDGGGGGGVYAEMMTSPVEWRGVSGYTSISDEYDNKMNNDDDNDEQTAVDDQLDKSYVPDGNEEYYTLRKRPRKNRKTESSPATRVKRTTRSSKNKR